MSTGIRCLALGAAALLAVSSQAAVTLNSATLGSSYPTISGDTLQLQTYADPSFATNNVNEGITTTVGDAQTFTPATNFTLGAIVIRGTGGGGTLSAHLFDINNPHSLPGSYNLSTDASADLLGGPSVTYNGSGDAFLVFTMTGAQQVSLTAGHLYAFEVWTSTSGTPAYWTRGAGSISTYAGGDMYHTAADPSVLTSLRAQVAGSSRDAVLAVYAVPEPATLAVLAGALGVLALRKRS